MSGSTGSVPLHQQYFVVLLSSFQIIDILAPELYHCFIIITSQMIILSIIFPSGNPPFIIYSEIYCLFDPEVNTSPDSLLISKTRNCIWLLVNPHSDFQLSDKFLQNSFLKKGSIASSISRRMTTQGLRLFTKTYMNALRISIWLRCPL